MYTLRHISFFSARHPNLEAASHKTCADRATKLPNMVHILLVYFCIWCDIALYHILIISHGMILIIYILCNIHCIYIYIFIHCICVYIYMIINVTIREHWSKIYTWRIFHGWWSFTAEFPSSFSTSHSPAATAVLTPNQDNQTDSHVCPSDMKRQTDWSKDHWHISYHDSVNVIPAVFVHGCPP